MKRIYSIMFAAVAILAAASCQKEMAEETFVNGNGGDFSITASLDVERKTVLEDTQDGNKTYWAAGDKISVFNNEGKEVVFSTNISSNSLTAPFTNEAVFDAPDALFAIYPDRSDKTSELTSEGIITNLHIGTPQTAVAGSFDPIYAPLVGIQKQAGSNELAFSNVHSLVKFTIGGDKVPAKVTFTNEGQRSIAGLFYYNTVEGKVTQLDLNGDALGGLKYIDLVPETGKAFEIGKTYYIAFIGGGNLGTVKLSFDGTTVKTVSGDKIASADNNFFVNKIFDMGEVSFPEVIKTPSVTMNATEVLSKKSGTTSWLTSLKDGVANMDRNAAFDGTNVYIANVNTSTPQIFAIPIATTSEVSYVDVTGVEGGYFPISCIRTIKNGEEHMLIGSNMENRQGYNMKVYAWTSGINSAPVSLVDNWTIPTWGDRRFGDQFTVCGDWTNGELWFKDFVVGAIGSYKIGKGVLTSTLIGWGTLGGAYLGSVYKYSLSDANILVVPGSSAASLYNLNDQNETKLDKTYNYIGGLTPFTYNDKNFIAYVSLNGTEAKLVVIEDNEANLKTALNDGLVVFEKKINADDNTQTAQNSGMSCNVVTKNGKTYLFGHAQNIGFAVYEITGLEDYTAAN